MVDKETEKKLIEKAFEMKEKAYCPYSKYHVGAALLSKSGKCIYVQLSATRAFAFGCI